jgi:RimJ/RimL family protein N-acetyltransferase
MEETVLLAPEIATDHLILNPLSAADVEALFAYRSLPEVCRYQSWAPASLQEVAAFIEGLASTEFDTLGTWFQLGIRLRESRGLIGDLGVHFLDDGQQVEVGFTTAPAFQRKGLATEAVVGLLDCLFGSLGKHRVTASVDPRNTASLGVVRRIGMRQEAHFVQSVYFKGGWVDDLVFAVLAQEWSERQSVR